MESDVEEDFEVLADERVERITVENASYEELASALVVKTTKDGKKKKIPVGPFRYYAPCMNCSSEFERNPRGRGRFAKFCNDKCKNDFHNTKKKEIVV